MAEYLCTCVVTTDGTCITTTDGTCVVTSCRPSEGGGGRVEYSKREIPVDFMWKIIGWKIVPVSYSYDVIAKILQELLVDMLGDRVADIKPATYPVTGEAALLKDLIVKLVAQKGIETKLEQSVLGEKAYSALIEFGIDGLKVTPITDNKDVEGEKLSEIEAKKKLEGTKLSLRELATKVEGIKAKLLADDTPITGAKINEAIKEYVFSGDPDIRALLYLLFDEDEIENANIIQKLKDRKSFYVILDEEDENDTEE